MRIIAIACLAACTVPLDAPTESVVESTLVNAAFIAQGLAGKCISVDQATHRLQLRTCRRGVDQQLMIVEQAEDHLVQIRAGTNCLQPLYGVAVDGVALEMAPCAKDLRTPWQRWILDGDSIRIGPTAKGEILDLFVAVADHSGREDSPLALASRRLDESDYWELTAVDPKGPAYPTSGFVRVHDQFELADALDASTNGSVVDIAADAVFTLTECGYTDAGGHYDHTATRLQIHHRVTLRSGAKNAGRRPIFAGQGAQLKFSPYLYCREVDQPTAIYIGGDHARVTGFRLEGISTEEEDDAPRTYGIMLSSMVCAYGDPKCSARSRRTDVDHMDLSGFKEGAVVVWGASLVNEIVHGDPPIYFNGMWIGGSWNPWAACRANAPMDEVWAGVVSRNYIHHNRNPDGYGVTVSDDGHATIIGNTFLHNRHAISAEGTRGTRFVAEGNLVHYHGENEQDFDVHGSAPCNGGARGGVAGERFDIRFNTFLGADRNNFYLRGTPCLGARFANNVTRQDSGDAERVSRCAWEPSDPDFIVTGNQYEISDPTADLAVGDFNGDGTDDLFMATGAAYYVSFSGRTSWQLRAFGPEKRKDLLFGDFDGDRRTDLIRNAPDGNGIQIRYGGEGDWVPLRPDVRLPDLLAGDFDADGDDDLFLTTGTQWKFSPSNNSALWTTLRNDTRRAKDLRVGNFDFDPRDDIFGVLPGCGGSCWVFHPNGGTGGFFTGPALAPMNDRISLADVDANGRADVVIVANGAWRVSIEGFTPWINWGVSGSGKDGAVGNFLGGTQSILLVWDSLTLRSIRINESSQYHAYFEMF